MDSSIQKHIRFPKKAVELVEEDLRVSLGINFSTFLQNVVISKAEEILDERKKSPTYQKSGAELLMEAKNEEEYQKAIEIQTNELLGL